ncbi:MAG: histidinol-phosphatase [Ignavibacteria bacterium]|nr:histidinol-phosphatase [Ignavibacteria bacterium]MBI3764937.1 histidinol-phosphatase [Ignavibacteriales bacterium]
MKKLLFVDRDGTIIREPPDKQIDSLEKLWFIPGIITGLKTLVDAGFTLVMVSNQDGLGSKKYPRETFRAVQKKIITLLRGEGIHFERIFICPHWKSDYCSCRKPKIGLVDAYLKRTKFDRIHAFMLGDRETDVEFARNLGFHSVRLTGRKRSLAEYKTDNALDACTYIVRSEKYSARKRMPFKRQA